MNDIVLSNEQEFRENYRQGSTDFVQIPFEECALDFIPVSENGYRIFDKEKQEFSGTFVMDEAPIQGKEPQPESILYTDTWDFGKMLSDMRKYQRPAVYILLDKLESKFASFFKLPHFKELYLRNVIAFKNEMIMYRFFEECLDLPLPGEIVTEKPERYWNLVQRLHQKRISDFISKESETVPQNLFQAGESGQAYTVIKKAVRKNPNNFMVNRVARLISASSGNYDEAVKFDTVLKFLHKTFPELPVVDTWTHELMGALEAQYHIALA